MRNRYFILLFFFILTQVIYSQVNNFAPAPSWVKPVDIPINNTINQYDISSGFYQTLVDYQLDLDKNVTYINEVRKVLSYNGISNASQLSVVFDTIYQQLDINHLYIWRNGNKFDRTKDLSFEILNNEYDLEQGIYNGTITAYDILNDIRKDDLIDFAYTVRGANPIFDDEQYLSFPISTANFIDKFHVLTRFTKNKSYQFTCVDCDSVVGLTLQYDSISEPNILSIEVLDFEPITIEEYVPSWVLQYPYFFLSSMDSWIDVNKWAQKVFKVEDNKTLSKVYNEVFKGDETLEEKINLLIDYVQDDIRYMGIESGIWGVKPTQPDIVLEQRYGDCKDKSLLLVSLLKDIGIENAYPVLINTVMLHDLSKYFPSNQRFNHCIVCFNFDSCRYWVDPTSTLQGGDFKNLYNDDYGKVLIIGEESDSLTTMSPREIPSKTEVAVELDVTSFTKPAKYTIVSNKIGHDADLRRVNLEYYSLKDFSKSMKEDVEKLFSNVSEISDIVVKDDIDSNILSLSYEYEVVDFWKDNEKNDYRLFRYEPIYLYQYFSKSTCEDRKQDFLLKYPIDLCLTVKMNFPKEMFVGSNYRLFDNEVFFFEEKTEQISAKSIQITYSYKLKKQTIPAKKYVDICKEYNKIVEKLPFVVYFPKN